MADLNLRNVDPSLLERIQQVSVAHGWNRQQACVALLEQGLFANERTVRSGFERPEAEVLSEAIAALHALPAGAEL